METKKPGFRLFSGNCLIESGIPYYGYEFTLSDDATGSDINFIKHCFFYRKYIPLGDLDHHNINIQFRLGYISQSVFGPPEFRIGGSRALSGYDRDVVEGNVFTILNIEYLRPMSNRETFRGVVFADVGNAWEDTGQATLSELRYALGYAGN